MRNLAGDLLIFFAALYKLLNFIRKLLPYSITFVATLGNKNKERAKWNFYWSYSCSLLYGSFLGKLKLKVYLPTGRKVIIRLFSQDSSVLSELFKLEPYYYLGKPSRGAVVIDAGANIGLFTIMASSLVGNDGLVLSIEPLPDNYDVLLQNIEINSLKNVIPLKAALGKENGIVNLYLTKGESTSSSISKSSDAFLAVPQVTLDTLFRLFNCNVDFIKMDIEGAECEVLKSGQEALKYCKPVIAMELHKDNPWWQSVLIQLHDLGYDVYEQKVGALDFVYARHVN